MRVRALYIVAGCFLTFLLSCAGKKKEYTSFDEYPVRTDDLSEMAYSPTETKFTVWAPTGEDVRVMLFESGDEGNAYKILKLEPGKDGTWSSVQQGDLKGKFYTFNVKVKGRWLGDTPGLMAKAVGINGLRAAIIPTEETDPEGWESDLRPPLGEDNVLVLYRLHIGSFSADTTSGIKNRGKFLSFTEAGTRNSSGLSTGIDHLKELGVTHVQLMPCFDFSGVDESLVDEAGYRSGFSPLNYNVPEGSFSTDARSPQVRIREFKKMVQAFHKAGIRVVMDVAYSYSAGVTTSGFDRTAPGYFYKGRPEKGLSEKWVSLNETAGERPMMRKFMIESLRHWVNEYHVDGFCFDRMDMQSIETMNAVCKALYEVEPTLFLYGKAGASLLSETGVDSLASESNIAGIPGMAVLHTTLCEGLMGKENDRKAFLFGLGNEETIRQCLAGASCKTESKNSPSAKNMKTRVAQPLQRVNMDLADGTHWSDKLTGYASTERISLFKLVQTVLFTSQGIPLIYSADEWMAGLNFNEKGLQPVDWNAKTINQEMFEFCKALVSLRKSHPAFRLKDSKEVNRSLDFLPVDGRNLIAYQLKGHPGGDVWEEITVVLNSNKEAAKVKLPEGKYTVISRNGTISPSGMGQLYGGEIVVPAVSALILYK